MDEWTYIVAEPFMSGLNWYRISRSGSRLQRFTVVCSSDKLDALMAQLNSGGYE